VEIEGVPAITNMTLDGEGRIVATVHGTASGRERAVARMDRSGVLDPGFGERGLASLASFDSFLEPRAIVVQQSGAIRIGGDAAADDEPVVLGLTADGRDDGLRIMGSGPSGEPVQYLMDQQGALVASHARTKAFEGVLVRYTDNGTPDPSFEPAMVERAVAITADGAFITAGRSLDDAPRRFLARRVTRDGQLDPTFGGGAVVIPDVERHAGEIRAAARRAGGLVMVGVSGDETPEVFVARFDGAGVLDASFGGRGYVTHDLGNAAIVAIAELADGGVMLAGMVPPRGQQTSRALSVRLAPDGSLDTSFGESARFILEMESSFFSGLVVMPDGEVIAGGSSGEGALLVAFPPR
jgi:uncharacterized delta-60 repeat protein